MSSATAATTKKSKAGSHISDDQSNFLYSSVKWLLYAYIFRFLIKTAYQIRMTAIDEYGPVIHEFDPYFNYRATEYLFYNGWERFFKWFDYMVWYPLGRPVGTTIYPGMQFTAVWIQRYLLPDWSLNDVCCYVPAWFGAVASTFTGLIAYEASVPVNSAGSLLTFALDLFHGKKSLPDYSHNRDPAVLTGLFSMAFMTIVPAHLMRSMGGGYDNESIAMTAMCATFWCWMRSLRGDVDTNSPHSYIFGILTGLFYFYMVAAWGGYVFVLNMIGVHAAMLMLTGRFCTKVYLAYTLFYITGTVLAIQVPVVGWAPLKSLEQLGPAGVFGAYQLLQCCEIYKRMHKLSRAEAWKLRAKVFSSAFFIFVALVWLLAPTGYFGPISSRVRGLFVQHTKTGNPLVDSVAEHQPASSRAYFQYLHHVCSLAPVGFITVMFHLSDSSSFLLTWGTAAYFFSHKMVRLILLTAPIGCVLAGICVGRLAAWCLRQWWDEVPTVSPTSSSTGSSGAATATDVTGDLDDLAAGVNKAGGAAASKDKKKKSGKKGAGAVGGASAVGSKTSNYKGGSGSSFDGFVSLRESIHQSLQTKEGVFSKRVLALVLLLAGYLASGGFVHYCYQLSQDLSNPTIIMKARTRDGQIILLDDYREAYWWLRDNTPTDARIMAWWDYGYQITAIANRTTLADGNTWNHEHIALLGMSLTTNLEEGYEIARHWADYVLIWGGGGGDDLAKSPHLARIANSVYRHHCPDDPTCRAFGFVDRRGTPSPMMERSLLYRLHGHAIKPGVEVPEDKFQEVYRSKYGKVRIYKILGISEESKRWAADPKNRKCDVPGSWFCPGQYPPGLSTVLSRKKDFAQLEDFNRGPGDEEYVKKYFEDLQDPNAARKKHLEKEAKERLGRPQLTEEDMLREKKRVDEIYNTWEDTDDTTLMWKLISSNNVAELRAWLEAEPEKAFIRSKDGRGPMWWAFEQRNEDITKLFMKAGVPHTDRDAAGMSPVDLLQKAS